MSLQCYGPLFWGWISILSRINWHLLGWFNSLASLCGLIGAGRWAALCLMHRCWGLGMQPTGAH